MGLHLPSHALPRRLRPLYMDTRQVQRLLLSLGRELALRHSALHGPHRFLLYRLASLHPALAHPRPLHLRRSPALLHESLLSSFHRYRRSRLLLSSRHRHLEFSLQVGTRRHRQGSARRGSTRHGRRHHLQSCRRADSRQLPLQLASLHFVHNPMRQPKIIVVGGGLAGLMATIRVAESGVPVDLFSIVPVKRSHSVCAQAGINAAKNQKGEGDTTSKHFDATIYGGAFHVNTLAAAAGIVCTGGIGASFGRSTNSVVCTGTAQSALFQQGVDYANGEFIQVHPTAIPGEDKLRLMSESARGEGGRVWVPKKAGDTRPPKSIPENERFYFLEEWYPKYGNLVPRDIATRAIHRIVFQEKLGLVGQAAVYLDVTNIPREVLDRKLEGILEIYEKFLRVKPREEPMKVFPSMHYTMGGMWVNPENQATSVPRL